MTGKIKLTFSGRDCTDKSVSLVTTGSVETVTAAFAFDAEWDGFVRTAIFTADGTVKRVVLDDANACAVPWEVLENCKQLTIGVVGTSGNRVLPSVPVTIPIIEGVCNGGTPPDDPTPDIYAQLLDLAKETQQIAQSVRDDADAGKFTGSPGDKGEKGDTGEKGDKGDKGDTGAKGDKGDKGDPGAKGDTGDKGAKGDSGADGHSPVITASKSGKVTTIKSDNKTIATVNDGADGKDGVDGAKGDPGAPGADGYTPVRGTDYWTDADKAAINADIAAQVAGKVDKIDGKGLSTNDYTDADKAAVAGLRSSLTHIGDIEITESDTKIAVKDNLALRMAAVLLTVPDGSPALNVEFKFDDGSTVVRYCSNLNAGRAVVEIKNGMPYLDYSYIKGADTSTQTVVGTSNHIFRTCAAAAVTKVTRIRIIVVNSAALLVGSKFEFYGVTA